MNQLRIRARHLGAVVLTLLAVSCGSNPDAPEMEAPPEEPAMAEPQDAAPADPVPPPAPAAEEPAPASSTGRTVFEPEESFEDRLTSIERAREDAKPAVRDNYLLILGGVRQLDEDVWDPVDAPATGGVNYLGRGPWGWLHWDMAFHYGSDDATVDGANGPEELSTDIWEIDLGLTKIFALGSTVRPYVGAGVAYLRASGALDNGGMVTSSDSDTTFGGYARAGVMLDVTDFGGMVGVDVRYVGGTSITLGGVDADVDGLVGSIMLGFSW